MNVKLILSVLLLFSGLNSRAEQTVRSSAANPTVSIKKTAKTATKFKDGDRVAFIGASNTQIGRYHREMQLFYATRYPSSHIVSRNFGIGGDTAEGVLRRYGWDISPFNPNRATINIGLNDIGYYNYDPDRKVGEQKKEMLIEKHLENMDKLVKMLKDKGIPITVITLTPVDETGTQERKLMVGVNAAITKFNPEIVKIAAKYDAELIDITEELERLNLVGQKEDPDFTLVGPDRVHLGAVGHLAMAYLILKAQGCDSNVASMSVDAGKGQIIENANCEISDVSKTDGGVSFTCLSGSLPFPVSSAAEKALTLVPFTDDLNREILTVSGLHKGEYELLIDGQSVFSGNAKDFKAGINLATNKNTPQYRQAVEVQKAVEEYADQVASLRLIALVEHGSVFDDLPEQTDEARFKRLKEKIAEIPGSGDPQAEFHLSAYSRYLERKPKQLEMEQNVQLLFDHIYEINKPKSHKYTIRKKEIK